MIEHTLDVPVRQHDDGSASGMHDLDIVHPAGPSGAVEVTSAADGESMAAWKQLNPRGERWIEPTIKGGWIVTVLPSARTKRIKKELPELLRVLEGMGLDLPDEDDDYLGRRRSTVSRYAEDLGVVRAHQSGTAFPGSIYIDLRRPIDRTGGWVADTGDALAEWIGSFLVHEDRRGDRDKLLRSGAPERHLFLLFPTLADAPFAVTDLLMRDNGPLPSIEPSLPDEVTHVWTIGGWSSGSGMRWAPDSGWSYFDKL
jgi:hypothetical protein